MMMKMFNFFNWVMIEIDSIILVRGRVSEWEWASKSEIYNLLWLWMELWIDIFFWKTPAEHEKFEKMEKKLTDLSVFSQKVKKTN